MRECFDRGVRGDVSGGERGRGWVKRGEGGGEARSSVIVCVRRCMIE